MSFSAGSIAATLGLDMSGFATGMMQANAMASMFPNIVQSFLVNPLLGVAEAAKAASAAIAQAIAQTAQRADDMGEQAAKLGVSVEYLSAIGAAAKDAGAGPEALATALREMQRSASEAVSGNKDAIEQFARLGISSAQVAAGLQDPQRLLLQVSDGLASLGSTGERTALAMGLLGRGGADMVGFLQQGSAAIMDQANTFATLGGAIDTNLTKSADKFQTFGSMIGSVWAGIQKELSRPFLDFVADNFEELKSIALSLGPSLMIVAKALGDTLVNSLRILLPVLQAVAKAMEGVAAAVSTLQQSVAGRIMLGGMVGGPVGYVVAGLNEVFGSTTSATTQPPQVNIANVNVAPVNVNEASSQLAAKLYGPLRDALNMQQRSLQGIANAQQVRSGL